MSLLLSGVGNTTNVLASVPWVVQWKFNNNGNDSIGANNLTNNNSATFTTGKLGGATGATQLVNASAQYWSITDNASISFGTGIKWLIYAWVYPDAYTNDSHVIISKGSPLDFMVDVVTATQGLRITNNQNIKIANAGTVTPSQWNLAIVWYDGTNIYARVNDGAVSSVSALDTNDSTGSLAVGQRLDAGGRSWDGRIDNVGIAKSASTFVTQEILDAIWNNGNGTETLT